MRSDYPREKTSVLIWLLCAIVAGSAVQFAFGRFGPDNNASLLNELKLSVEGIRNGQVWTLLTSSFLHNERILLHLGINLLGLFFIGRELLPILGPRRFAGLYFGAIVLGGLTWLAVHWNGLGGNYYGATAGIDALLVVFACFYPDRRMDFVLFFVFPFSVKPKHVAFGLLFFELFGLMVFERPGKFWPFELAMGNSAHLGGMFAGWFYYRYFHDISWHLPRLRGDRELSLPSKRGTNNGQSLPAVQIDMTNPSDVRAEVDRILDKINSHGFNALTADEKRLLDEAKGVLSRD